MSQENELPKVREYTKTAEGFALELHWEPIGVVELPEMDEALIYTHVGAAAKLSCRRNGRRYSGTFVHGDIDITPARVPVRWEIHDRNDNGLILSLPQALLSAVAAQSGLDPWKHAGLPSPPKLAGLGWVKAVGPGVIVLGGSIGSGEFLLGPAAFVRHGLSLLWVCFIAIFFQTIFNF